MWKKKKTPQEVLEKREKSEIRKYFDDKPSGVFVEVGAYEPLSVCSQSWHLEDRLKWRGLLVEPNPVLAGKARSARPGSTVCECACTSPDKKGEARLFIPLSDGKEISGHASMEVNADDFNYNKHKTVDVKAVTLTSLLDENNVTDVDLLSVDVEGTELDVLRGLDFDRFKPRLILLEDKHVYLQKHRFLKKLGYRLVKRTGLNCWYIPKGAKRPNQPFREKARLLKRLYLSIWLKKIMYAITHRTWKPFRVL